MGVKAARKMLVNLTARTVLMRACACMCSLLCPGEDEVEEDDDEGGQEGVGVVQILMNKSKVFFLQRYKTIKL